MYERCRDMSKAKLLAHVPGPHDTRSSPFKSSGPQGGAGGARGSSPLAGTRGYPYPQEARGAPYHGTPAGATPLPYVFGAGYPHDLLLERYRNESDAAAAATHAAVLAAVAAANNNSRQQQQQQQQQQHIRRRPSLLHSGGMNDANAAEHHRMEAYNSAVAAHQYQQQQRYLQQHYDQQQQQQQQQHHVVSSRPRLAPLSSSSSSGGMDPSKPLVIDTSSPSSGSSMSHHLIPPPLELKKEPAYIPQVEAISPTLPEGSPEKSSKDEILGSINKLDREITQLETQLTKLRRKQQELEAPRSKSSSTDAPAAESKQLQMSLAQIIYAENRKKAVQAHAVLSGYAPNLELPLYNQPSDIAVYHENQKKFASFRHRLIAHIKAKNLEKTKRETYITERYQELAQLWLAKLDRKEANAAKKTKDQKQREFFEKQFPELKKQREERERFSRAGQRIRSDADLVEIMDGLQEQENEERKMRQYAIVPPMLLTERERQRLRYDNRNGLVEDMAAEYKERQLLNVWTQPERDVFREKYVQHPKNFALIASFLERKTTADCVQYYYLSKKSENYKQLVRKHNAKKRTRAMVKTPAAAAAQQAAANQVHNVVINSSSVVVSSLPPRRVPLNGGANGGDNGSSSSGGGDSCALCQGGLDEEGWRPLTRANCDTYGLRESDLTANDMRVCTQCRFKTVRLRFRPCPLPSCRTPKRRVKRLRPLPSKLDDLSPDSRQQIRAELQIPDDVHKCCSNCYNRILRKLEPNSIVAEEEMENVGVVVRWTDEEQSQVRSALREYGTNWPAVASRVVSKTSEQCRRFYVAHRRRFASIVTAYRLEFSAHDQITGSEDDECEEESMCCYSDGAEDDGSGGGGGAPTAPPRKRASHHHHHSHHKHHHHSNDATLKAERRQHLKSTAASIDGGETTSSCEEDEGAVNITSGGVGGTAGEIPAGGSAAAAQSRLHHHHRILPVGSNTNANGVGGGATTTAVTAAGGGGGGVAATAMVGVGPPASKRRRRASSSDTASACSPKPDDGGWDPTSAAADARRRSSVSLHHKGGSHLVPMEGDYDSSATASADEGEGRRMSFSSYHRPSSRDDIPPPINHHPPPTLTHSTAPPPQSLSSSNHHQQQQQQQQQQQSSQQPTCVRDLIYQAIEISLQGKQQQQQHLQHQQQQQSSASVALVPPLNHKGLEATSGRNCAPSQPEGLLLQFSSSQQQQQQQHGPPQSSYVIPTNPSHHVVTLQQQHQQQQQQSMEYEVQDLSRKRPRPSSVTPEHRQSPLVISHSAAVVDYSGRRSLESPRPPSSGSGASSINNGPYPTPPPAHSNSVRSTPPRPTSSSSAALKTSSMHPSNSIPPPPTGVVSGMKGGVVPPPPPLISKSMPHHGGSITHGTPVVVSQASSPYARFEQAAVVASSQMRVKEGSITLGTPLDFNKATQMLLPPFDPRAAPPHDQQHFYRAPYPSAAAAAAAAAFGAACLPSRFVNDSQLSSKQLMIDFNTSKQMRRSSGDSKDGLVGLREGPTPPGGDVHHRLAYMASQGGVPGGAPNHQPPHMFLQPHMDRQNVIRSPWQSKSVIQTAPSQQQQQQQQAMGSGSGQSSGMSNKSGVRSPSTHDPFTTLVNAAVAQPSLAVPKDEGKKTPNKQIAVEGLEKSLLEMHHLRPPMVTQDRIRMMEAVAAVANHRNVSAAALPLRMSTPRGEPFSREQFEREMRQQPHHKDLVARSPHQVEMDNEASRLFSASFQKDAPKMGGQQGGGMTAGSLIDAIITRQINQGAEGGNMGKTTSGGPNGSNVMPSMSPADMRFRYEAMRKAAEAASHQAAAVAAMNNDDGGGDIKHRPSSHPAPLPTSVSDSKDGARSLSQHIAAIISKNICTNSDPSSMYGAASGGGDNWKLRKALQTSSPQPLAPPSAHHASMSRASPSPSSGAVPPPRPPSSGNTDGRSHVVGLSPLDYVNNRIMEVMRDGTSRPSPPSEAAPQRATPPVGRDGTSPHPAMGADERASPQQPTSGAATPRPTSTYAYPFSALSVRVPPPPPEGAAAAAVGPAPGSGAVPPTPPPQVTSPAVVSPSNSASSVPDSASSAPPSNAPVSSAAPAAPSLLTSSVYEPLSDED